MMKIVDNLNCYDFVKRNRVTIQLCVCVCVYALSVKSLRLYIHVEEYKKETSIFWK